MSSHCSETDNGSQLPYADLPLHSKAFHSFSPAAVFSTTPQNIFQLLLVTLWDVTVSFSLFVFYEKCEHSFP